MLLKGVSVRYMTMKKLAAIVALIATSAFGLRGAGQEKVARFSGDLLGHIPRHTSARTRVIVHGDAAALAALTTRHHVQVLRTLADGAVVSANSAEIDEIAADSVYDHLSGDPFVRV